MEPSYRTATRDDIPTAADIFVVSVTALAEANGLPRPNYTGAMMEPVYLHLFESGIFEIAELGGKVVGFAAGIVRGELWFLSMFWVLPEHKLHGIGKPLLDRVWKRAESAGAKIFATWSSIDLAAVSTYLKRGMMPACQVFTFAGPVQREPKVDQALALRPLIARDAAALDRETRGEARLVDHEYWRARGTAGFLVERAGHALGYFYLDNGVIGPAAWSHEADGEAMIALALTQARAQANEVKLIALGLNHTAIRAAGEAGLRLISTAHFLRSASFGALECYLPSGPALF